MTAKYINSNEARQMISKTASSRFQASRRFMLHNYLSLFSVSFFSLVLIVTSIPQVANYKFLVNPTIVNIGQLSLSILLLSLSIAIGLSDFSLKSHQHHACGMELNKLVTLLKNKWDQHLNPAEYNEYIEKYYSILEKYENHSEIDYKKANLAKCIFSKNSVFYYSRFSLYFIMISLAVGWVFFLGMPVSNEV
jgi:hypothetical protein